MAITPNGQTGLHAVDRVAVESKPGNANVSTPVLATVAEVARRLGQQEKRSTAIQNLAQVNG